MLAGMWHGGHLTPNEWDNIRSHLRLHDQLHYFYRVWACKEVRERIEGVRWGNIVCMEIVTL